MHEQNTTISEKTYGIVAKISGNPENRIISYRFEGSARSPDLDKIELLVAQIQVCKKLLLRADDEDNEVKLRREITALRLAVDMLEYQPFDKF